MTDREVHHIQRLPTKDDFKPGDLVAYHTNRGWLHGTVEKIGTQWIHVRCIARDPRLTILRKFRPEDLKLQGRSDARKADRDTRDD